MREPRDPLAVDTETTGLRVFQGDRPIMASFADDSGAWALPPDEASVEIRRAISEGRTLVMHNSPFDRAVFSSAWGIEVPDEQVWDTMGVDWVLDENADHRLKEGLGSRLFGVDAAEEKKALQAMMRGRTQADVYRELREIENAKPRADREKAAETKARAKVIADETTRTWADMTYDELKDYAEQDAFLTWKVFWHQQAELAEDTFVQPYFDQAHRVAGFCYRITKTGVRVDQDRAAEEFAKVQARIDELSEPFSHVNLKSPTQVAALLYDEWKLPCTSNTASGNRGTDKDVLESLRYDERVEGLIEFRQLAKQVDAYYLPLLDRVGIDGRIHPSLNAFRTVTGRFSCSGPNLQTIPRESTASEIRKVFIAADGMTLTEWDLSQIEVRIAADMSREPALLAVYEENGDVYQALADEIGVTRDVAKTTILSAQYGVGAKTLSKRLAQGTGEKPDVAAAKRVLTSYWQTYPQLRRLMHGLEEVSKRRGYLPLWKPGRRRRFRSPHLQFPKWYTALNAAIQGGAAEMLKDVLLALEAGLAAADFQARIVLTVHDSIIIEHEPGIEPLVDRMLEEITRDCSPYTRLPTPWDRKPWQ